MSERRQADIELGIILATPNAIETLGPAVIAACLDRHAAGDWGDLTPFDWHQNELALEEGTRLFSAYETPRGKAWVITEWDRSSTCVLLPQDY
jgi:hypothetical protein